jgi:hypothetical protein
VVGAFLAGRLRAAAEAAGLFDELESEPVDPRL